MAVIHIDTQTASKETLARIGNLLLGISDAIPAVKAPEDTVNEGPAKPEINVYEDTQTDGEPKAEEVKPAKPRKAPKPPVEQIASQPAVEPVAAPTIDGMKAFQILLKRITQELIPALGPEKINELLDLSGIGRGKLTGAHSKPAEMTLFNQLASEALLNASA